MFSAFSCSVQAVLEESPTMEGEIPIPNFGEVTSPVKLVEKESATSVDERVGSVKDHAMESW